MRERRLSQVGLREEVIVKRPHHDLLGVEGGRPSSSARGAVGKRQGMSAPRLATTVELAFALLSWLHRAGLLSERVTSLLWCCSYRRTVLWAFLLTVKRDTVGRLSC